MTLSSYTCGANCWWKLNYNYSNNVNDTTTWKAYRVTNLETRVNDAVLSVPPSGSWTYSGGAGI